MKKIKTILEELSNYPTTIIDNIITTNKKQDEMIEKINEVIEFLNTSTVLQKIDLSKEWMSKEHSSIKINL